jgi:hypothetical protein
MVILVGVVGFAPVVSICCTGGDEDDGDDTVDISGAADNKGFTVFGIPHTRASVVLTTLRSGLRGSHIIDLSSGEVGLPAKPPVGGDCAYIWTLLQTAKIRTRGKNAIKV